MFELNAYNMNRKQIELFVAKEKCQKSEAQTTNILLNQQTNVVIINSDKVVWRNLKFESLVAEVYQNFVGIAQRASEDISKTCQIFSNMKIFKPITAESAETFSLLQINDKLTDAEPTMHVKIKFQNQNKRIFEISKQNFNLNLEET